MEHSAAPKLPGRDPPLVWPLHLCFLHIQVTGLHQYSLSHLCGSAAHQGVWHSHSRAAGPEEMEDKPRLLGLHAKNSKADSLYLLACRLFMKIYAKPICASALPSNVIRMESKVIRITLRAGKDVFEDGAGGVDRLWPHARARGQQLCSGISGGGLSMLQRRIALHIGEYIQ